MKYFGRLFRIGFVLILLLVCGWAGWHLYWLKTTPRVVLTHQGFEPDLLIIHEGDTVEFSSTRGLPYWPASDDHPSHMIYSDFDPKRAIGPKETWSYRFDKVGNWRFHNHIGSSYAPDVGTIQVIPKQEPIPDRSPKITREACLSLEPHQRQNCWERLLRQTLSTEGIRSTFALVKTLYTDVPDFAMSCNAYTHRIGGQSYLQYRKDLPAVMIPETLYCGAGFFHGFLEVFVTQDRRLDRARQFCTDVENTLATEYPLATHACIHGLGHGIMELLGVHTVSDWKTLPAMLAAGFTECETLDTHKRAHCVNGMFNAVLMHYAVSPYKPVEYADNPFWFCPAVPETYQPFCYEAMGVGLETGDKSDMKKAETFIVQRVPERYVEWAMRTVIQELAFASVKETNWDTYITGCKALSASLTGFCLDTFVESLVDNGSPGTEYVSALTYCKSRAMLPVEQEHCLDHTLSYMRRIYGTKYPQQVCTGLPKAMAQKYCE